jgi:hypothetical protein
MSNNYSLVINVARFLGMALGMAVSGAVLAVIGGLIGGRLLSSDIYEAIGLAAIGIVTGYFLGNILGLALIKKFVNPRSSIWLGVLGGFTGVVITVAIAVIWEPDINLVFWLALVSVPILSLAGFYLKR